MSEDPPQITGQEFDSQVRRYLDALEEGAALTADDYAQIVRLWNTISWGESGDDEALAQAFKSRVFPGEVRTITEVLGMTPSKGMALYSRERDLYLGGAPHANSRYEIVG
jgi:hypothetical protein